MKSLVSAVLMVGFLAGACSSGAVSEEEFLRDGWPFGFTEQQISDMAEGGGWSFDDVRVKLLKEEVMAGIATQILKSRPEVFEEWVVDTDANKPPTLYVRGPADEFVRGLVEEAPIRILLVDNLPFPTTTDPETEAQIVGWSEEVRQALGRAGFLAHMTHGDGLIRARIDMLPWDSISREEVLAAVRSDLRDLVEVSFSVLDVPPGLDWGPMAVTTLVADPGGSVAGHLRIGEQCVVVEDPRGGDRTVLWDYRLFSWDELSTSILWHWEVEPFEGVIRDGDPVVISGALWSDTSFETVGFPLLWVAEPDSDCPDQVVLASAYLPDSCGHRSDRLPDWLRVDCK